MIRDLGNIHTYFGTQILGWFTPEQKKWYHNLVTSIKNGIIVEIGVYGGASLLSIASTCKVNRNQIYAIDLWDQLKVCGGKELAPEDPILLTQKTNKSKLERLITKEQLNFIHLMQTSSTIASKKFTPGSVDLVFIDGEHTFEAVKQDIDNWWKKVKAGGVLAGHDYLYGGKSGKDVSLAVNEFSAANRLQIHVQANCWFIRK